MWNKISCYAIWILLSFLLYCQGKHFSVILIQEIVHSHLWMCLNLIKLGGQSNVIFLNCHFNNLCEQMHRILSFWFSLIFLRYYILFIFPGRLPSLTPVASSRSHNTGFKTYSIWLSWIQKDLMVKIEYCICSVKNKYFINLFFSFFSGDTCNEHGARIDVFYLLCFPNFPLINKFL